MLAKHERLHALGRLKLVKRLAQLTPAGVQHALCDVDDQLYGRVGVGTCDSGCTRKPPFTFAEFSGPNERAADHFKCRNNNRLARPTVALCKCDGVFAVSPRERERMDL